MAAAAGFGGCHRNWLTHGSGETLQLLLIEYGFNLAVTGAFGPKGASVVRAFQRNNGLTSGGIVGPKTWAALRGIPV